MALVKFNTTNVYSQRRGVARIRINRKSAFWLNSEAVRLMELEEGDKVGFYQDDEEGGDWFITKDDEGFPLRAGTGNNTGLGFNTSALANLILDSVSLPLNSYKFNMANEAIEVEGEGQAWCIIMASVNK